MARVPPLVRAVAIATWALAAACARAPELEPRGDGVAPPSANPAVTIESAAVVGGKVEVTYRLTDLASGAPITGAAGIALTPSWTLAWLDVEPVSGLRAWRSMLLVGSTTVASLPPAGPGTPSSQVLTNVRQPGGETSGSATAGPTVELPGDEGRFKYTYASALPSSFWPSPPGAMAGATLRVGVYLRGVTTGTKDSATTHDFTPNGSVPESRELVRQENCSACHGLLKMHGGRISGVNLCVTCHTWLLADPDTVDPAAMAPATKATFPNPLELARMTHRIHRGKKLPTLFLASSSQTWPAFPFTGPPPLPYLNGRNAVAPVGTKYAVIGNSSTEYVYGRVASRVENFQPAKTLAEGLGYPQDLRNCDACHGGAKEAPRIGTSSSTAVDISRRGCSGCHPDVFYGDPNDLAATTPDATHFAHTGGRQLDDTACKDCHVVARAGGPKLYAPIAEIHRPLNDRVPSGSPRWSRWSAQIVSVQDMKPGLFPTVTLRVFDRHGAITPTLGAPVPAYEPASASSSPGPRALSLIGIVLSGPTTDYLVGNVNVRGTPALTTATDANGVFSYTFTTSIPSTATGTWAVGTEGRRRPAAAPALYTAASDSFNWPYTGESVSEYPTNQVKYVDLSTGAITSDPARARRTVVEQARCERCHLELNLHGANRHDVAHCLLCHAPDMTDWDKRPRDTRTVADGGVAGTGVVLLHDPIDPLASLKRWGYATLDGIEERSIHFKTMVHRIHVGERKGAASLEGILPFVIYGMSYTPSSPPNAYFFDDVRFPGDLANCELCHLEDTWAIESVPAGAQPTIANERPSIRHAGTSTTPASAAHPASEAKVLPITATCLSCHTSGAAVDHAAGKTVAGVEQCATCHGASGAESVRKRHAVP